MTPFKSERAAKMAMTKAEKAYETAKRAATCAYGDAMAMEGVNPFDYQATKRAEEDAAWDVGAAVYAQAQAQGFYVKTWYFGTNVTRDLIAANID